MADVLIVLGMHRSGTSAIAGMLTKMGGAAPNTLLPADPRNERGYFESVRIMHFHDELLASAKTNWRDWRALDQSWYNSLLCGDYHKRAKILFNEEFADAPLAVFKDPRVCRFLPFWLAVFAEMSITPRIIIPVRSPLEVAYSLKERGDGVSIGEAMLLWLRHLLDAEASSRTLPRSITFWRSLLLDWRGETEKIAGEIGLPGLRSSNDLGNDIDAFLSKGLVHNSVDDAELALSDETHPWTIGVYESLKDMSCGAPSSQSTTRLDRIKDQFDQSCTLFKAVFADTEARSLEMAVRVASMQAERGGWQTQLRTLEHNLTAERLRLDRATTKCTSFEVRLKAQRSENDALFGKISALTLEVAGRRAAAAKFIENDRARDLLLNRTTLQLRQEAEKRETQERDHADVIDTLRGQLVDAEAALARLQKIERSTWSLASRLTPRTVNRKIRSRMLVRSRLFDADWYAAQYEDIRSCGLTPAEHYLEKGYCQGYFPNPLFNTRWYLRQYEDVRRAGVNPLLHYAIYGYREGRDPGPDFQTLWYLEFYPDVKASGMNPLAHFLHFGQAEGRASLPINASIQV